VDNLKPDKRNLFLAAVRRRAWILPALLLPVAVSARPAGQPEISLAVRDGLYHLRAVFFVSADPQTVWEVLTDYDHVPRFVSLVTKSKTLDRDGNNVLIRQDIVGRFFFVFRRLHLKLRVEEEPLRAVRFEDILGTDFVHYQGSWTLREKPGGEEVTYELAARPRFTLPTFLVKSLFARSDRRLINEMRKEMMRRWAERPEKTASPALRTP
jgi:ribosome-associated toxin RatA of RatAB toxin-antitoxin module